MAAPLVFIAVTVGGRPVRASAHWNRRIPSIQCGYFSGLRNSSGRFVIKTITMIATDPPFLSRPSSGWSYQK
jgi:hypothetical protein